ncbi:2778_t:CDS:2 [Scutellospora calospora]|uniref:2778_t:CDS:1 n=1 Tax=Scutellospora calospora TaxID=85575 RepID=A0ACA9L5X1_9GLOM|nr:2778_t:CDS:2 [Scutellospora calospora]
MSQIRSDILQAHKIKEAKEYKYKIQRLYIAILIISNNEIIESKLNDVKLVIKKTEVESVNSRLDKFEDSRKLI